MLADESDPHVLAGALKLFFRELPEPLLGAGGAAGRPGTEQLTAVVEGLPPAHRSTLELLLRHLNRWGGGGLELGGMGYVGLWLDMAFV